MFKTILKRAMAEGTRQCQKRKSEDKRGSSPSTTSTSDGQHSDSEKDCDMCRDIVGKAPYAGDTLSMHLDIQVISPPTGKRKKNTQKQEEHEKKNREKSRLLEKICALRNSKGGCLVIYFENMEASDKHLGQFDEMIDDKLQELVEDGTLFSESYSRQWISGHKNCLCITCNPSTVISAVDYKTQMSLNKGLTRLTALNILYILASDRKDPGYKETDLNEVREASDVQLKSSISLDSVEKSKWARYIMDDLRLKEYISAFANQKSGGFYFLGIDEENDDSYGYHRKQMRVKGFSVENIGRDQLEKEIRDIVKEDMLWVNRRMEPYDAEQVNNCMKFTFHPHGDDLFVMEVFVKPVQGIVFQNKTGPESFRLSENNEIIKVDIQQWHQKLLQLRIPSENDTKSKNC